MMNAADPVQTLTILELFVWGAIGAFGSYLVVFALPELLKLRKDPPAFKFDLVSLLAALGVGAIFVLVGGLLTIAYGASDSTSIKQPLAYGLGVEGILGGTLKAFSQ